MFCRGQVNLTSLLLVLAGSFPVLAQQQLTIHNLKSGLVCRVPGSTPRVCTMTPTIEVTGQDHCVYNGGGIRCTWYGYSFDYDSPKDTMILQFQWSSSVPHNVGN